MNEPLHINEPFYTAGRKYGWNGDPQGIGVRVESLNGAGVLRVTVSDKSVVYWIEKQRARDTVRKYNSFFRTKSAKLGVIPWSDFMVEGDSLEND